LELKTVSSHIEVC